MQFANFANYVRAGYPVLWVETHEERRAISNLSQAADGYQVFSWDLVDGLADHKSGSVRDMPDPLAILQAVPTLPDTAIVFLKDFHKFIENVEVFRCLKNLVPVLKATDRHIVIISPVVNIPAELEKDISLCPFQLPTVQELTETAERIVSENELDIPVEEEAIAASKGLTLDEAENAFALSLVVNKGFTKATIEAEKLQAIKKSGLMELYEPVPESELGGLVSLKQYIHNRRRGFQDDKLPTPKGILLVGLPGGGKSLTAKVTASVLDFPLIRLDVASLKGSLVGESERKMREATTLIDAVAPCVVWLDEIEKALGGVQSSNRTDGGTTSAMFGHLLTWMQESASHKYIVATCNDIDDLLAISQGALLRRFDDVFFVDLPNEAERREILAIMNRRYGTDHPDELVQKMDNWTGAEIEKFVISAIYDGDDDAFANMRPIFHQNRDKIEKAREWARFNARLANKNGHTATGNKKARRVKA